MGQLGLLESTCDVKKEFVEAETETSMKYTFGFQWVAWRLDTDCKLGMSLRQEQLGSCQLCLRERLSGRTNRIILEIPELCDQDLRPGDFVEIVRLVIPRSNKNSKVYSTST